MAKPTSSIPLLLYTFDSDTPPTHRIDAFTTQRGEAINQGAYDGYNLATHTGDDATRVMKHRTLLCDQLGILPSQLIIPTQTHSLNIAHVDSTLLALPINEQQQALNNVDAVITNLPNIYLGILTADCVPVLLYDATHQAVAAIHAGWRGTVGRIANRTLTAMSEQYGTRPEEVQVIIGPSISLQAFEVGQEVYDAFEKAGFHMPDIAEPFNKKWHIDLWWANADQLQEMGVPFHHIYCSGLCSVEHANSYFSARTLGLHSGRSLTAIAIKP